MANRLTEGSRPPHPDGTQNRRIGQCEFSEHGRNRVPHEQPNQRTSPSRGDQTTGVDRRYAKGTG